MCLPCVENNTHGKVFLKELHLVSSEMRKGRKYFAVRYNKNARQTTCLPCVFPRRTANNLFGVRFFFAVRYIKNARQTSSLPCARNKTHGKDFDARQTRVFPLCDKVERVLAVLGLAGSSGERRGAATISFQ
jgi:hypothetical protein